jgi:hypothetical protein
LVWAVAGAWSVATLAFVLAHAVASGLVFVGPNGAYFPIDQLRYLAWIREAGTHGLIADPFRAGASHLYLNPVFLISGLLWRMGLSVQAAYLIWTPIAVGVLTWGYARFTGAFLSGRQRAAALAVAVLFLSPLVPLFDYGGIVDATGAYYLVTIAGHGAAYWQEWGYLSTVIALGLMPLCALRAEVVLNGRRGARDVIAPAVAALLVGWLNPWGGIELVLVLSALVAWRRFPPGSARVGLVALAAGAPLVYYAVIAGADAAWSLAQLRASGNAPLLWPLLVDYGPLLLLAVLALRRTAPRDQLLILWPAAAFIVYCALTRNARGSALEGVTLPLAILAVRGWRHLRAPPALSYVALFLAIVPGAIYSAHTFHDTFYDHEVPFALARGEQRAMDAVERLAGNVLSTGYLAPAVPALAGHAGHVTAGSDDLFDGRVSAADADRLVAARRIGLVISDCLPGRTDLLPALRPLGFSATRYGCATLYRRTP